MSDAQPVRIPKYRLHKPTGLGLVRIKGRDCYLGKHGTQESLQAYRRIISEWLANGRQALSPTPAPNAAAADWTINELFLAYWSFAERYYVKNGRPTGEMRSRLIREDKRSENLIKPLLRGRDIDRWRPRQSSMYLIAIPSSENHDWPWGNAGDHAEGAFKKTYPAVHEYLSACKTQLRKRQDQGRYWWELRSCDYMDDFDQPKLIWQEMAWFNRFTFDNGGHVILNTAYMIATNDLTIPAILNSPLAWWYMWRSAQHGKDEVLRLIRSFMEVFPFPAKNEQVQERINPLVQKMTAAVSHYREFTHDSVEMLRQHCDGVDDSVIPLLGLDSESFLSRLAIATDKRASQLPVGPLTVLQEKLRSKQVNLLSRQFELENQLAVSVEEAYELTAEERRILRATRPVRDPLDVLEAKIAGSPLQDEPDDDAAQQAP